MEQPGNLTGPEQLKKHKSQAVLAKNPEGTSAGPTPSGSPESGVGAPGMSGQAPGGRAKVNLATARAMNKTATNAHSDTPPPSKAELLLAHLVPMLLDYLQTIHIQLLLLLKDDSCNCKEKIKPLSLLVKELKLNVQRSVPTHKGEEEE